MLRALDIHVHTAGPEATAARGDHAAAMRSYFRQTVPEISIDEQADYYRQRQIMAVLLAFDSETATGTPPVTNDFVADAVRRHPDVFIGFASVDPNKGKRAEYELQRAVEELGLRGLKLHPAIQGVLLNDRRHYPLWELCQRLGIPILTHTGMSGRGAGLPGGGGIRLDPTRPVPYIDDLARDFPELTIIGAHPSWPWQDEMLAIAVHKSNVYIDLSGWSPKYFPKSLIQYANTLLQDKVLFGSDFPLITADRWLEDFAAAPFKDEVRPKILYQNAVRLLGLDPQRFEPAAAAS